MMRFPFFSKQNPPPKNAPPARTHFDWSAVVHQEAALRADSSRGRFLNLMLGTGFLTATLALAWISTHHTIQPYVLTESRDGAVKPANESFVPYEPGIPETHYFVGQWVKHLMSLDRTLSENWLKEAYQQTRGKASIEFTDWIKTQSPLQALRSDPSLTRSVTISSVSVVGQDLALIRVTTERRSLSNPSARIERWLVTLHFVADPPKDEETILKNPIGLLVTDFQIGEDLDK